MAAVCLIVAGMVCASHARAADAGTPTRISDGLTRSDILRWALGSDTYAPRNSIARRDPFENATRFGVFAVNEPGARFNPQARPSHYVGLRSQWLETATRHWGTGRCFWPLVKFSTSTRDVGGRSYAMTLQARCELY